MTLRTTCKNNAVAVDARPIGGRLPPSTGHSALGSGTGIFKIGVGAIPGAGIIHAIRPDSGVGQVVWAIPTHGAGRRHSGQVTHAGPSLLPITGEPLSNGLGHGVEGSGSGFDGANVCGCREVRKGARS